MTSRTFWLLLKLLCLIIMAANVLLADPHSVEAALYRCCWVIVVMMPIRR